MAAKLVEDGFPRARAERSGAAIETTARELSALLENERTRLRGRPHAGVIPPAG